MNRRALPQSTVIGRLANRPHTVVSRSGNRYLLLLMYLRDATSARLLPVLAFGRNASYIAEHVQQGNRICLHVRIDAMARGRYLNPSLVAMSFAVLDLEEEQRNEREHLASYFPFVPSNYPFKNKEQQTEPKSTASAGASASSADSIEPSVSSASDSISNSASVTDESDSGDWLSEVEDMSDFQFPSLH